MGLRERFKSARNFVREVVRAETPQERSVRIAQQISNLDGHVAIDPELSQYRDRYGSLAGHAVALARLSKGTIDTADRREVHDQATNAFGEALRRGDHSTAEAAFRLAMDQGAEIIPRLPREL